MKIARKGKKRRIKEEKKKRREIKQEAEVEISM